MSEENPRASDPVSPELSRSNIWRMAAALVVVWLGVSLSSLDDMHAWGDDWAHYAAQARGLAEGSVERELELSIFRNAQSTAPFGPTVALWGLPLILAPVHAATDGDLLSLKIPGVICYALFLVSLFLIFEGRVDDVSRLLILGIFALNPTFFYFQNQLLTDIPFLFLSTFSLLLIDRGIFQRRFFVHAVFHWSLLGAVIFLACLTRTVGFLLLATVGAAQIMRLLSERPSNLGEYLVKRSGEGLVYGVAFLGLALAAWLLPSAEVSASSQFAYLREDGIGDIASRLFERMQVYALLPQDFFLSELVPPPVARGLALFVLVAAALGVLRGFRRDAVFVFYCVLSLWVLVLSDFFDGLRYVFPLLPFLLYFAIAGLTPPAGDPSGSSRFGWRSWNVGRIFAAGLAFSFAAHGAIALTRCPLETDPFLPFGEDGRAMLDYIANETAEDAVVIFFKPRAMTYITKRRSIVVSRFDQVFDGRADYIVLANRRVRDQLPLRAPTWRQRASEYEIVFRNRSFQIRALTLDPESSSAPGPTR